MQTMQKTSYKETSRKALGRPGNWEALPVGVRLTLTEAATILGVDRETLRKNYAWQNAPRKLPPGYEFQYENGRVMFLIRRH